MRIILDTVSFIWAVSTPERLSHAAMSALRKTTAVREISVVSLTEIAVKQTRGKLTFGKADALVGIADLRLRVLPYAAEHALRLFVDPHIMSIPSTGKSSRNADHLVTRDG